MTRALACEGVAFARGDRPVLRGVGLALGPGRVMVLVGPSGAGKTTLLWLLAGLLEPSAGRIVLRGPSGAAEPFDPRRARLGMVFQTLALWDHLTVEAHLALVLAATGLPREARRRRAAAVLDRMRLQALRGRRPPQLSGGERQRLAIARALVAEPEWLLLDEPLAHLDGPARAEVFDLLRSALADARAGILLATHQAAEALRLADDVAVLLDGTVVQAGPADEVYRHPSSLAAALALGPASEVAGEAAGGVLVSGGMAVLAGLPESLTGPQRVVVRPEAVAFRPAADGPAMVLRCERVGGAFEVRAEVAGMRVLAWHERPVGAGARGRLVLRSDG